MAVAEPGANAAASGCKVTGPLLISSFESIWKREAESLRSGGSSMVSPGSVPEITSTDSHSPRKMGGSNVASYFVRMPFLVIHDPAAGVAELLGVELELEVHEGNAGQGVALFTTEDHPLVSLHFVLLNSLRAKFQHARGIALAPSISLLGGK